MLVFNEALSFPEMDASSMNPNQLRHHGVEAQDDPCHWDPMAIRKDDDEEGFVACLKLLGTNVCVDTWTPTDQDLQSHQHVALTSPQAWDPHRVVFTGK